MQSYRRPAWAEINLKAIKHNIVAIKSLLPEKTQFMAVVKANAYGHGLLPIAETALASGADRLGVALLEEATELRQVGVAAQVQLLSEIPTEGVELVVQHDIIPTVYTLSLAQAIDEEARRQGKKVKVHLKVDTGMHRVGAPYLSAAELLRQVDEFKNLTVEGIFTHFACADLPSDPYTGEQLKAFLSLKPMMDAVPIWHTANSAAAFFLPESRLDMVRIGIAMYGLEPSESVPSPVMLMPALSLKAKIAYIRELEKGEGVSYGLTYKAMRKVKVAVVPIGYGDGYSRLLSNRGEVLIRGKRAKIIGNICMDQLMVELPEGLPVSVGDTVTLIGKGGVERISAEEVARLMDTINYEVVCLINQRVPRIYKEEES